MSDAVPFFRGQNVVLKARQDNKNVTLLAKVWDVEENATEVNEGVNGEHRDRLDKVTNFYSISLDVYQTDQEVMQAILDAQDVDDANGLPLKQTCAIQINHRDGTKAAYILQEAKFGAFKMSQSGRADAVMLNWKLRFRFIKKVPAI